LLIDTQVKHSLASSEYNIRRQECEEGVRLLSRDHNEIKSLRDVETGVLEEFKNYMNPVIYKRCAYVVHEINRVTKACMDLEKGDIRSFGEKMYETHTGLSEEYEVSCEELDFLVDQTRNEKAVIGARMMGGGFGGCTINLVEEGALDRIQESISAAYREKFDQAPLFYIVSINDGVSIIK
jgi:galactokinase